MATSTSYKKTFICEVLKIVGGLASLEVTQAIMKAHITGMITGIKKFPHSVIFSVDDGTGVLDCILWFKESASQERIYDLKKDVKSGLTPLSLEVKSGALSLLQRAAGVASPGGEEHGDVLSCLGQVKVFRGRPQLEIHHHYKGTDVNAETLWILDVLETKTR